jgi:hypothetical protein
MSGLVKVGEAGAPPCAAPDFDEPAEPCRACEDLARPAWAVMAMAGSCAGDAEPVSHLSRVDSGGRARTCLSLAASSSRLKSRGETAVLCLVGSLLRTSELCRQASCFLGLPRGWRLLLLDDKGATGVESRRERENSVRGEAIATGLTLDGRLTR